VNTEEEEEEEEEERKEVTNYEIVLSMQTTRSVQQKRSAQNVLNPKRKVM
jgi:hypothetical protein